MLPMRLLDAVTPLPFQGGLDLPGAVQHGVVGVDVEVDEVVLGGCFFLTAHLRHGPILGPPGTMSPGGAQRAPARRQGLAQP